MLAIAKNIRDIKRLDQVLNVLVKNELGWLVAKLNLTGKLSFRARVKKSAFRETDTQPYRIRKVLEDLGGTFVKLGQLLSLRPDLIPREYCDEFRKLQDSVKPFSGDAKAIVETELQKPITEIFAHFEDKPIAAASIGQVHEAILKDGTKVAVKVQRPGIAKRVDADIDILYHIAQLMQKHLRLSVIDPVQIVKEFERYTRNELDYIVEAKNVGRFHDNFRDDKNVRIPRVFLEFSTGKVLTLEFIRGVKASEIHYARHDVDKKKIVRTVVGAVYKQVFFDGFFHADPHPGNILVLRDSKVAFLDFGIVGYFDDDLRGKVSEVFISMILGNLDRIAESLVNLGVVDNDIDVGLLKTDLRDQLERYYGTDLRQVDISEVFPRLISLARKNHMVLPSDLVLLCKSIVTVQGFAADLDPEFNLVAFSRPFVKRLAKQRLQPKVVFGKIIRTSQGLSRFVTQFPSQAAELIRRIREGDQSIKRIDSDIRTLTTEIDRSSNRIALGLLITGFVIASTLVASVPQPMLLSLPALTLAGFAVTMILLMMLIVSILREKQY
ncbi:MAG: AarF/UbiB family protein [archaeon]